MALTSEQNKQVSLLGKTPTQINRQDNAKIASQYGINTKGNNAVGYNTIASSLGKSMKDQGAVYEKPSYTPTATVTSNNDNWLEDYYNSLMDRFSSIANKQQQANDLAYKQQRDDIESRFNSLSKRLLKNSAQKGWDSPVTNMWNVQASADDAKNDLAIEKAKSDADLASNNYNNLYSIWNSIANSSASDTWKKKFFGSY